MNAAMIDAVRKPKQHKLKTWPEYFQAVWLKLKLFDLRNNDRDFRVNDTLLLQEFAPCSECETQLGIGKRAEKHGIEYEGCSGCKGSGLGYLGREIAARVTYILLPREYLGLEVGHCILGFKILGKRDKRRKK